MPANTPAMKGGPCALTLSEIRLQVFEELDVRDLGYHPIQFSTILGFLMKSESEALHSGSPESPPISNARDMSSQHWGQHQLNHLEKVTQLFLDPATERDRNLNCTLEWLINYYDAPIFPNLLSLEYEIGTGDGTCDGSSDIDHWSPLLQHLVGPNLENVTLTIRDVAIQVVDDNIQTLARIAPRLRHLVNNSWGLFSADYAAFHQLRSLEVNGYMDHASWKSLADCPRLERIILCDDDSGIQIKRQMYSITLPCLKALCISDCCGYRSPAFIVTLFRNTTMPMLQTLRVFIQASKERRETARNEILRYIRGRSPILKEVVINGRVPGYDDVAWSPTHDHSYDIDTEPRM
ncbi:hypothetical protein FRB94_004914 [Tulasnella sp. JGI-2019a]|nr:hypothetical protein FRB93_005569 [Tulasnella sp. JGI-2019a]KAG9001116.1 hypothetical protein FRB94_004914 [Tulasnella sp. JGI-2019a]KAG9025958.1 hypothetical protein FRB95_009544 [Tulasnella sp. JGI-2019a]